MSTLLHDPILAQARSRPEARALSDGATTCTYGELDAASRALRQRLVAVGVAPGDRVAVALPKSTAAVVALLAILRAGAAYVPLDEQSPPERRRRIIEDAAVRAVVVDADEPSLGVPPGTALVAAGALATAGAEAEGEDPARTLNVEAAAYLLYTSGSTGTPKGVVVSHRAGRAFVDWSRETFDLTPRDRVASVAQLSFDLSIFDVFAGLAAGAEVHLVTRELALRPERLVGWLGTNAITTWYSVPSTLMLLVDEGKLTSDRAPALARVLFAGEVFPLAALRRALAALPRARFANLFGPTETNVCTFHRLPPSLPTSAVAIPIGRPCAHALVHLCDPNGQPVPDGDEGEICVGGPGVMSGYWNRPDATAAAFWPAGTVAGTGPLYRTGDRARRTPDGELWFLGRRDRQIKHRGYRIELDEVEATVAAMPGVREAAVITRPDGHGGVLLHAAVVPEPGEDLSVLAVKTHCGRVLPAYMVPRSVEVLSSLPRTLTGKLDLLRLR